MIIPVVRQGEMRNFVQAETITKRLIHKERVGKTENGEPVDVGLAYNRDGNRNVWLVALVFIGGKMVARAPFGQAMRLITTEKALRAWQRAVGYQLKLIMEEDGKFIWRSKRANDAQVALESIWPEHLLRITN